MASYAFPYLSHSLSSSPRVVFLVQSYLCVLLSVSGCSTPHGPLEMRLVTHTPAQKYIYIYIYTSTAQEELLFIGVSLGKVKTDFTPQKYTK